MSQLDEIDVGKIVAPLDSPALQQFVNTLAQVSAVAEASPGFVPDRLATCACWWVKSGHQPNAQEGAQRRISPCSYGASECAFDIDNTYTALQL